MKSKKKKKHLNGCKIKDFLFYALDYSSKLQIQVAHVL